MTSSTWLENWRSRGDAWLCQWTVKYGAWLAPLFTAVSKSDSLQIADAGAAARPPASARQAGEWMQLARQRPQFCLQPVRNGKPAHTGVWSRRNDAWSDGENLSLLTMLGCRLAEMIVLCQELEDPIHCTPWLDTGSFACGPAEGFAWVETSRGLLMYGVQVNTSDAGPQPLVNEVHTFAPTDWNFHPDGVVAQCLAQIDTSALTPRTPNQELGLWMTGFDPCVPYAEDWDDNQIQDCYRA